MTLVISADLLRRIEREGELAYPLEGAGFLLGSARGPRVAKEILPARNIGVEGARHNRYLLGPDQYMQAELEAEKRSTDLLGVFHSHPDDPEEPSAFDREWAQPNLSYVITSVRGGRAGKTRSWMLVEDRSRFEEESVVLTE
jgi:proteasome lid subunit RPN8/RPN11